ncbi:flagellar biosynthetic protein FliR [Sansalvadorimonas sp. 2012CJ34-2]|uniref:Flagellar biosynthetic protein FliR n=1 Tax=Parendozoicomonas callyspongiae TaxID=2942213 RepID=A0ABT0PDU9_9GAMM|nr:flagellar biosynthetic protein FliR [Sansalvadorimonas sp. 2012CJ34-2]MCL6269534.1 flagellar biosynthetic protein FliR [Sansalvadorimonas sp. 2012CJ34-2]
MLNIPGQALEYWITSFVWAFARISGFMLMFPVTGSFLPTSIRLLMTAVFSGAVLMAQPWNPPPGFTVSALSASSMLIALGEFFTGLMFGMVLTLWFSLFSMAGHTIGLQMGLGMAQMNDPAGGISVTVVSQIYQLAAMLMFFLVDGHTTVIAIVLESFKTIEPGSFFQVLQSAEQLLHFTGWIFSAALLLAMPALIALLIINISFGFMSRAAPQLNLLSLGFPLSLLSGLLIICLSFEQFSAPFRRFTREAILLLRQLAQT